MTASAQAKKKSKAAADREISKEIVLGMKNPRAWKVVRGVAAGKLVIRDNDVEVFFRFKHDALAYIAAGGPSCRVLQLEMTELMEAHVKSAEVWKRDGFDGESYFFLERV